MLDPSSPTVKRCFPPVVDERTRVLVLGSLPGEASLARGQYYVHPRNQFWRLIGTVIGRELEPLRYEQRLEALLAARIGLWDTVAEALRAGSLDTAIRNPAANDLAGLAGSLPELRAIAFNGGKSAGIGSRMLAGMQRHALVPLPSSSPALTRPFDDKLAAWMKLRDFL